MESNFQRCLDFVFAREGGYVDDPRDPGGATNLGITISTLTAWRGRRATRSDVRNLARAEAARIYRLWYWHSAWCGDLPAGVDLLVFDAAVNMGVERSLNILCVQVGIGIPVRDRLHPSYPIDRHVAGRLEQSVLDRLSGLCVPAVIAGLCRRRDDFDHGLATFRTFGAGWLSRVNLARHFAMHLWVIGGTSIP